MARVGDVGGDHVVRQQDISESLSPVVDGHDLGADHGALPEPERHGRTDLGRAGHVRTERDRVLVAQPLQRARLHTRVQIGQCALHALGGQGLELGLLLEDVGHEIVALVGSGPEIIPTLLEHRPDVAVLDVRLPPGFRDEGLRAAIEARKLIPGQPLLVLSQYVEESYAAELLGQGASGIGYLLKDRVGHIDEFQDALERVAAGGTALDPEVVSQLMSRRDPLDALSPREREVLGLMAQGLDNPTIATNLFITERSVSKHIGSILAKLNCRRATAATGESSRCSPT